MISRYCTCPSGVISPNQDGQARLQPLGRVAAARRPRRRTSSAEQREQPRGVREAEPVAVERVVRLGEALAVEADEERARALEVLADEGVQPGQQERAQLGVGLAGPEVAHRVLAEEVVAAEELVRALAGRDHLEARVLDGAREAQERRRAPCAASASPRARPSRGSSSAMSRAPIVTRVRSRPRAPVSRSWKALSSKRSSSKPMPNA